MELELEISRREFIVGGVAGLALAFRFARPKIAEAAPEPYTSESRALFIPGWMGGPTGGHKDALKALLEHSDPPFDYEFLDMGDSSKPKADVWLDVINSRVVKADNDQKLVTLVGHSLGSFAALAYICKYRPSNILSTVDFAIRDRNRPDHPDPYVRQFYLDTRDLIDPQVIRSLERRNVTIVYSRDDTIITQDNNEAMINFLGCERVVVNGLGHFGGPESANTIYTIVKSIIRPAASTAPAQSSSTTVSFSSLLPS